MTLDELWETILDSDRSDWVRYQFRPSHDDDHTDKVVYRHDVAIGLAWVKPCVDPFYQPWLERLPDQKAMSVYVNPLAYGHEVDQSALVLVDGYHAYLPVPHGANQTIDAREYRLARVVQSFANPEGKSVDSYLRMAELAIPGL